MTNAHKTSVRLHEDTHTRLRAAAFWKSTTITALVSMAVKEYLDARPELNAQVEKLVESSANSDER